MRCTCHRKNVRFDHDIVSCSTGVRPCLTVSSNTGIHKLWIDFGDALVVHLVLLQGSWKVVLDQDIAVLCKLVQDLNTSWTLER